MLGLQGEIQEAKGLTQSARETYERALGQLPEFPGKTEDSELGGERFALLMDLAGMHKAEGNYDQARILLSRAHDVADRHLSTTNDDPRWLLKKAQVLKDLGFVHETEGKLDLAREFYEANLAMTRRLLQANPGDKKVLKEHSLGMISLGDVLQDTGDLIGARKLYMESKDIREISSRDDPKNAELQRGYSLALERLAEISMRLGVPSEGLPHAYRCMEIRRDLVDLDPENYAWLRNLEVAYEGLARLYEQVGRWTEAEDYFRRCLDIVRKRKEREPTNADTIRDLSVGLQQLGDTLLQYNPGESIRLYDEAIDQLGQLRSIVGEKPQMFHELLEAQNNLTQATLSAGTLVAARESSLAASNWVSAVARSGTNGNNPRLIIANAHLLEAKILLRQGQFDAGELNLAEAIKLVQIPVDATNAPPHELLFTAEVATLQAICASRTGRSEDSRNTLAKVDALLATAARATATNPSVVLAQHQLALARETSRIPTNPIDTTPYIHPLPVQPPLFETYRPSDKARWMRRIELMQSELLSILNAAPVSNPAP